MEVSFDSIYSKIPPGPLSSAAHLTQGLQVVFPEVHDLMKTQVSFLVLQFWIPTLCSASAI